LKETLANADRLEKTAFFVFNGIRIYLTLPCMISLLRKDRWNQTGVHSTEILLVAVLES